jgi:hypothetical protein
MKRKMITRKLGKLAKGTLKTSVKVAGFSIKATVSLGIAGLNAKRESTLKHAQAAMWEDVMNSHVGIISLEKSISNGDVSPGTLQVLGIFNSHMDEVLWKIFENQQHLAVKTAKRKLAISKINRQGETRITDMVENCDSIEEWRRDRLVAQLKASKK